jgi:hypothetical protein
MNRKTVDISAKEGVDSLFWHLEADTPEVKKIKSL